MNTTTTATASGSTTAATTNHSHNSTTTTPTTTRPIHPCVMDRNQYPRSIEFTTWAYLFKSTSSKKKRSPNLVTASSNAIGIYTIGPSTTTTTTTTTAHPNDITNTNTTSSSSSSSSLQFVPSNLSTILSHLAGTIVSLSTIATPTTSSSSSPQQNLKDDDIFHPDALLIGFAGHARCVVLTIVPHTDDTTTTTTHNNNTILQWQVSSLLDLSPILMESSFGATTIYEQDMILSIHPPNQYTNCYQHQEEEEAQEKIRNHHHHHHTKTTAACILGGGVALAVMTFHHQYHPTTTNMVVTTEEPYLVPLASLPLSQYHHSHSFTSSSLDPKLPSPMGGTNDTSATTGGTNHHTSFRPTGFGDILDVLFLNGYRTEPVLVVLHSTGKPGNITTHRYPHTTRPTTTGGDSSSHSGSSNGGGGGGAYYYCTALSISTIHQRTAILWSVPIPHLDVLYLSALPPATASTASSDPTVNNDNCFVVVSNNTITFLRSMDGSIQQCLAVNGWAGATCTMPHHVSVNPVMKLSIQLDGCQITWITSTFGILILRYGQVYTIQSIAQAWTIIPLGQQLTGIGEIATCCNVISSSSSSFVHEGYVLAGSRLGNSFWIRLALDRVTIPMEVERLLQIYKNRNAPLVETTTTASITSQTASALVSNGIHNDDSDVDEMLRMEDEALYHSSGYVHDDNETNRQPNVIPPSDDDEDDDHDHVIKSGKSSHRSMRNVTLTADDKKMTIVRSFLPVDCIVNVGPLGPSCSGPIDKAPLFLLQNTMNDDDDDDDDNFKGAAHSAQLDNKETNGAIFGAVAEIYPSGYGSSGGIAYMTVPGRDDRMIVSETDCLQNECIFTLSYHGIALMGMSSSKGNGGGIRILKQQPTINGTRTTGGMKEIDYNEWCSDTIGAGSTNFTDIGQIFQSTLVCAGEYAFGERIIIVVKSRDSMETSILIGKYNAINEKVEMMRHQRINLPEDHVMVKSATITNVSPIVEVSDNSSCAYFSCLWSNGDATLINVNMDGDIATTWIEGVDTTTNVVKDEMDIDDEGDDDDADVKAIEKFYHDKGIVAVDVFQAPVHAFEFQVKEMVEATDMTMNAMDTTCMPDNVSSSVPLTNNTTWHVTYDAEDDELYSMGVEQKSKNATWNNSVGPRNVNNDSTGDIGVVGTYFAVCRKSGNLDIYAAVAPNTVIWSICGANLGFPFLIGEKCNDVETLGMNRLRLPRSHCIAVTEMRFFACGPTMTNTNSSAPLSQNLCLSIVTSEGDLYLYTWSNRFDSITVSSGPTFRRLPLRSVARVSQEQIRHRSKLSRKGVLGKDEAFDTSVVYNKLHRFSNISGQDGMFAALARPQWFVSERGQIVTLDHRMRHAAPAGASVQPIQSFGSIRFLCNSKIGEPPLHSDSCGYITVHERIGRVGSQRLSVYKGLSDVFESNGILLGNGCCMEKVMLGVTVRRIVFIDDDSISTGDHPLYAVLVSREVEMDQSDLNTDGLSDIERQMKEQERETMKIQKQVEADLGGFDMESEWVESIERENAFQIQTELGGAPPLQQSIYSLWIIDAANKWMVIDSYQLDEYEHGIDLKMLYLTEFQDETGGTTAPVHDPHSDDDMVKEVRKRLFIALGTGIVNQDGEDVTAKGRVLLFNVKRSVLPEGSSTLLSSTTPFAELTLAYEKTMFHGPVTTLSCLASDNDKNRLVIGAGSDINIEMWNEPQSKLIQVGFFRATMHILNIVHFKNFLLLSDAYDSIYLLVFRESDKSLTLLAKDYDPIPVYATGIMTRGAAMTFVCHDDRQNLQFFQYAPGEAAARGGNKLVCRADFHLGKQTTSFRTHYCRPSLYIHSATPASTLPALKQQDALFGRQDDDQRIGVNFGTSDGSIISIIPLSEPIYWRLMALQSVMSNALESDCVLNHRAWRLYRRSIRRGGCRSNDRKKGVIDGDLILKYPDLPIIQQEDLASAIGSTVELILDNLLEVQCASMIL